MPNTYTAQDVAAIFRGQEVIDRKRAEVKQLFFMLNGFLGKNKLALPKRVVVADCELKNGSLLKQKICESSVLQWEYDDRIQRPFLHPWEMAVPPWERSPEIISVIHAGLPKALAAIAKQVPKLAENLKLFINQAKET